MYLDYHDTVIKAFKIRDMPPPPGKSMHELRCSADVAHDIDALVTCQYENCI